MWRAKVIERISAGWVTVVIPDLYRQSPVRGVKSVIDAQVDDEVLIADMKPGAKIADWLVVGYASNLGRPGTPYAHTHPMGQVDGLVDALAAKADDTDLTAKADLPGAWTNCAVSSYLVRNNDTTAPFLSVRTTPFGVQLRGYYRTTSIVPADAVIFTLPTGFDPPYTLMLGVPTMGPGSAYAALTYQIEIRATREVTARQEFVSGARMSFNHTFFY